MATVHKEKAFACSADAIWEALADVGAVHVRLAPGFVADTVLEPGFRIVTFTSGFVAREAIISVDPGRRRLAYAIVGHEALAHHSASFRVLSEGAGCRLEWTADLLPDAMAATISSMMDEGLEAMGALYRR